MMKACTSPDGEMVFLAVDPASGRVRARMDDDLARADVVLSVLADWTRSGLAVMYIDLCLRNCAANAIVGTATVHAIAYRVRCASPG